MNIRAETILCDELRRTLTFRDPERMGTLRRYLDAWPMDGVVSVSADTYARHVAAVAVQERRVSELLRLLVHLERDSASVRTAVARTAFIVRAEEEAVLLEGIGEGVRHRAEGLLSDLRRRLSVRDAAPETEAYTLAMGEGVFATGAPEPVTLWEAFKDLSDAPDSGGGAPIAQFTGALKNGGNHDLVPLLLEWCEVTGQTLLETVPSSTTGRQGAPARLLVWFRHGEGDGYRLESWSVLNVGQDGRPVISPRSVSPEEIRPEEFGYEVFDLFHRFRASPGVEYHDRTRVELILPVDMLIGLDAPHWEPRSSVLDQLTRLGAKTELIYTVEEFLMGRKVEHDDARISWSRRWEVIRELGEAHMYDHQCDTIPPPVRLTEYIAHEGLILFSAGPHEGEGEDILRYVRDAALSGVPVITWRTRPNPSGKNFRDVLVRGEGKVSLEAIKSLPTLLHLSRSGWPMGPRRVFVDDCMNVGVIYHDQLPHPLTA